MHKPSTLLLSSILYLYLTACGSRGEAAPDPASPTPVAEPDRTPAHTAEGPPPRAAVAGWDEHQVPVRADQAPLVEVRDALVSERLLGRRVRVAGRCTGVGEGRTAGSWTLEDEDAAIEVRGRVPRSCPTEEGKSLTIFAQVERKAAGSRDRLLLRLPD